MMLGNRDDSAKQVHWSERNGGKPWTEKEDKYLKDWLGISPELLAMDICRPYKEVQERRKVLGLYRKRASYNTPWFSNFRKPIAESGANQDAEDQR